MPTSMAGHKRTQARRPSLMAIGFIGLCVMQGSTWLLPEWESSYKSELDFSDLLYLIVGLIGIAYSCSGNRKTRSMLDWTKVGALGVMLVGVPELLVELALRSASATTVAAGMALVPVVVSVVVQQNGSSGRALTPALAAFGGVLLLLPSQLEFSWSATEVSAAALSIGLAGVLLHQAIQGWRLFEVLAACGFGNGTLLLVSRHLAAQRAEPLAQSFLVAGLNGLGLVLLLWMTSEMNPLRVSSRFLFVPIVTVLEGAVLMRPVLTARMVAGFSLAIAGGLVLVFRDDAESHTTLKLS